LRSAYWVAAAIGDTEAERQDKHAIRHCDLTFGGKSAPAFRERRKAMAFLLFGLFCLGLLLMGFDY
jgi:hypothetical protein